MEKRNSKRERTKMMIILIIIILVLLMPAIYTASLNNAIRNDNVYAVKFLLVFPGNINRSNDFIDSAGDPPLVVACYQGNPEIVKMLIEKGADLEPPMRYNPLIMACESRNLQRLEVVKILVEAGADVNSINGGYTPLTKIFNKWTYDTAEEQEQQYKVDFDTMKYLIDHGARLDFDHTKDDILPLAASVGNLQAVEYLVMSGEVDIDAVASWGGGHTALIEASEEGYIEIVRFLLENGADPIKKDKYGNVATIFARENGYEDIAKLIEEYAEQQEIGESQ